MENLRKNFLIFFMLVALAAVSFAGSVKFTSADDDEDERYEESDDEEDEEKAETVTETIRLPDQYVTKTIIENIVKKDSDRDGLLDENDPHPDIAEIYIVKDENRNGIDDRYDLNYGN